MYPEYSGTPQNNPNFHNRRMLVGVVAAVLVVFAGVWLTTHRHSTPSQGTMTVQYTPADVSGVSITIGGTQQKTKASPAEYRLTPGSYTLKITAPGYHDFTATVPITLSQTTLVNAQLTPREQASITSPSQLALPAEVGAVTILNVQYFYNNSWAVVRLNTTYDTDAVLVMQRDQGTSTWKIVVGPALGIDPNTDSSLPTLIQQYLSNNGYIVDGD
jgi:hypothetical protein